MIYYLKEIYEFMNKVVNIDVEKMNGIKKLRRELQYLSKEEDSYSKFI
jgi:hypothetical protein